MGWAVVGTHKSPAITARPSTSDGRPISLGFPTPLPLRRPGYGVQPKKQPIPTRPGLYVARTWTSDAGCNPPHNNPYQSFQMFAFAPPSSHPLSVTLLAPIVSFPFPPNAVTLLVQVAAAKKQRHGSLHARMQCLWQSIALSRCIISLPFLCPATPSSPFPSYPFYAFIFSSFPLANSSIDSP
jgi:hypothetical protein